MSSSDSLNRRPGLGFSGPGPRLAAVAVLAMALVGCIRPLYGPSASGLPMADTLASIDVANVVDKQGQERIGHYTAQELRFWLDRGDNNAPPKVYRLTMDLSESVQTAVVDTTTGRATAATLVATANYTLRRIGSDTPVLNGTATASASYDRSTQRFAIVRAARDAEIRAAKLLAEEIKNRLAAGLLSHQ